jgi:hypothetical protein
VPKPSFARACWNCKPVSVPRRAAVIPLGRASLPGSSNLPGSRTERAAPPPLFGLAPHGVYPAGADYSVRGALLPHLFTLTLSPSESLNPRRYFFCGTFRETRFERVPPAVSRHAAQLRPDFPPDRRFDPLIERPPLPRCHEHAGVIAPRDPHTEQGAGCRPLTRCKDRKRIPPPSAYC